VWRLWDDDSDSDQTTDQTVAVEILKEYVLVNTPYAGSHLKRLTLRPMQIAGRISQPEPKLAETRTPRERWSRSPVSRNAHWFTPARLVFAGHENDEAENVRPLHYSTLADRENLRLGVFVALPAVEDVTAGLGVRPPHCLKKNGTPAAIESSRSDRIHSESTERARWPLSPPAMNQWMSVRSMPVRVLVRQGARRRTTRCKPAGMAGRAGRVCWMVHRLARSWRCRARSWRVMSRAQVAACG
jgi:hypothetical protein